MDIKVRWTKTCRNLVGERFNRLVVQELVGKGTMSILLWRCECDCGNSCIVATADLKKGQMSCGCYIGEGNRARQTKHGLAHTREYRIWGLMIERCSNPNNIGWKIYGGKGTRVCDRWLNSVEAFIEDMGMRPSPQHSIDRIDSNGDYELANCRWATKKEQARNTSRNRFITHDGLILTLAEWSERTSIPSWKISQSIKSGRSVSYALTTPPKSLKS